MIGKNVIKELFFLRLMPVIMAGSQQKYDYLPICKEDPVKHMRYVFLSGSIKHSSMELNCNSVPLFIFICIYLFSL